jgi:hypothetical protein
MLADPRSRSEVCQLLDHNCIGDEVSTLPLYFASQLFPGFVEIADGQLTNGYATSSTQNCEWMVEK